MLFHGQNSKKKKGNSSKNFKMNVFIIDYKDNGRLG